MARNTEKQPGLTQADLGALLLTITLPSFATLVPFASPNMNSIMSSVPDSDAGIASAVAGLMRVFGQVVSMAAVMIVLATVLGRCYQSRDCRISSQGSVYDIYSPWSLVHLWHHLICSWR